MPASVLLAERCRSGTRVTRRTWAAACSFWLLAVTLAAPNTTFADNFTIRLDDDRLVKVAAKLAGRGPNELALEFADGRLQLIPADRVVRQETSPDPAPLSHDEMLTQVVDEFGTERVLTDIDKPYVVVLIRATKTLPDAATLRRMNATVNKAGTFFKGMQVSFLDFLKQARVETTPIKYPLVVLIFESDRHFDAYTASVTGGDGLSAENIAAFYDLLTNRLVVRLRECQTFDTPLHEAVHQQVYNRGILQRLAPVPSWFNEGLATGFEGDGERVRSGPKSISDRYGQLALRARVVSWKEVVANDRTFQGDVLAAEAYGHAWGLHWLLVTKYRSEYNQLVRHYASKEPLSIDRPDQRIAEFERIVGKSVDELQEEFTRELARAMARRKK